MKRQHDERVERVRAALSKFLDHLAKKIVEDLDRKQIQRPKPVPRRLASSNGKWPSHRNEK
jgi:hypothetical protein